MPWLNGTLHPTSVVPFDLADRGLLLGDGVFDTSLVLGGRMVWRAAHVARLVAFCQVLGFAVDAERVDQGINAVLDGAGHGSLRITVTRGAGPRGLAPPKDPKPAVFVTLAPLRTAALFAPLALATTAILRNETSPAARVKSMAYLDSVLASREAIQAGCDDALFLNTRGHVACTTSGNVLALVGDQIVTPPPEEGVVAGTARDRVLKTCDELGLEPVERALTPAELDGADAVVVTNSLRLVAPVSAIGRTELGSSSSHRVQALIAHIAGLIRDEVGVDPRKLAEA
jgi:branched-chain amino acid aminotransferase